MECLLPKTAEPMKFDAKGNEGKAPDGLSPWIYLSTPKSIGIFILLRGF